MSGRYVSLMSRGCIYNDDKGLTGEIFQVWDCGYRSSSCQELYNDLKRAEHKTEQYAFIQTALLTSECRRLLASTNLRIVDRPLSYSDASVVYSSKKGTLQRLLGL